MRNFEVRLRHPDGSGRTVNVWAYDAEDAEAHAIRHEPEGTVPMAFEPADRPEGGLVKYYVVFGNSDAGVERGNPEEEVKVGPFEDPVNFMYDVVQGDGGEVIGFFSPSHGEWVCSSTSRFYTDVTIHAEAD